MSSILDIGRDEDGELPEVGQFSQQAMADTKVTKAIEPAGDLGAEANLPIALLMTGAAANAEPQTNTNAICMAKANNDQTPLPKWVMTSIGD